MRIVGAVYVLGPSPRPWPSRSTTFSGTTLLEVIRAGILPIPVPVMLVVFGRIAMIAISNTTLVTVVAQARSLYGMGPRGHRALGIREGPPDAA